MAITNDEFRAALGRFASGVSVVTTKDAAGNIHGLTVSAFCSVSMEPPLILICVAKAAGSHYAFEESGVFVVNILNEKQRHISNQFASKSDDKFEGVSYHQGFGGLPVLDGCLANLECRLMHSYDGGDHSLFVGEIEEVIINDGPPLIYWKGAYQQLISATNAGS